MTVAAIWHEPDDNALWSVADTVITTPTNSGFIRRTTSGAKLFRLRVEVRPISVETGVRRIPRYELTYGFAYAGDLLPASLTATTAAMLLENLISDTGHYPPNATEIAEFVARVGERFTRDVMSSSNGHYGRFEAAVFGYCLYDQRFRAFHLRPIGSTTDPKMQVDEVDVARSDSVLELGSGRQRLLEKIADIHANGDAHGRRGRSPKLAIEALVDEDTGDVGGSVSIGICLRNGFRLYAAVRPKVVGQPSASIAFNGIELDEVGPVGPCLIGINGIV